MAAATDDGGASQWRAWMASERLLLDTPEKAVDFAEAVVRAAYGPQQVAEEQPFQAEDRGEAWLVRGERRGSHALPFFAVSSAVTLAKKSGAILDYRLSMPASPEVLDRLGSE